MAKHVAPVITVLYPTAAATIPASRLVTVVGTATISAPAIGVYLYWTTGSGYNAIGGPFVADATSGEWVGAIQPGQLTASTRYTIRATNVATAGGAGAAVVYADVAVTAN